MLNYVGLIHKDGKGYGVSFPDLPGCVSAADSLDELYEMAVEAATLHLQGMMEDGEEVPDPMALDEALQHEFAEGSVSTFVVRVGDPGKLERVNVSVPEVDLAAIDRAADRAGNTRSAFMIAASLQVARQRTTLRGRDARTGQFMPIDRFSPSPSHPSPSGNTVERIPNPGYGDTKTAMRRTASGGVKKSPKFKPAKDSWKKK